MPGRVMFGLAPGKRNRAEFEAQGLADGPFLSLARVIIGIGSGLFVFGFGYDLHHPGGLLGYCAMPRSRRCQPPLGSRVPMLIWIALAALTAAIIITWPYLKYAVKTVRHRI
jgi:hypothetical protein